MQIENVRRAMADTETDCEQLRQSLWHSEDRFRKLFRGSSNLMMITTLRDGRIIDLNDAISHFGGYKREELIGHFVEEHGLLVDPEDRAMLIRKLHTEGKVYNLKTRMRTKSGEIRTILVSADPILINNEPCIVSVSVDITAREKESEALRESEEKYRMVVENSLQGLAILQDGRFVFCNAAFSKMMGYSVEELVAFTVEEMPRLIHPDHRPAMKNRYLDRLAGRPVPSSYQYCGIRKDGTEVWMEAFASPIEYHGRSAVQVAYMDVTERKKAEDALRASEEALKNSTEYLNQIINCLGDPVFVKDEKHRFLVVNDALCSFANRSRQELLSEDAFKSLPKEVVASLEAKEQLVFESGRESLTEEVMMDGHGNERTLMTKKTLLTDKNGKRQIIGVIRDITEYKQLQAQFLQSQKMEAIGVLAGGIAHDFNNLLTVIRGYTELLLEDCDPVDPRRGDLEQVAKAAQRANSLTEQLLAFSRKQICQPEILNLNDLLRDTAKLFRRLIGEDIQLSIVLKPGLGLISADPGQIQQVLMNLVVNARDAMPMGGKLIIETANVEIDDAYVCQDSSVVQGEYVMLSISDNGVGMDKNTQSRIFEPFFTTKEKGKGTGLGLSTVYGIMKQSNGFVRFHSEPGKGTIFKVYFPRAAGQEKKAAAGEWPDSALRGSETILLVEDEDSVRALAGRILRDRGYNVLEAACGMDALAIAQQYSGDIHLVLTDVVMPGISGSTLVSRLGPLRPGIKTLYVSGYTDSAVVRHGILNASAAFLQKPYSASALARKVREVLQPC